MKMKAQCRENVLSMKLATYGDSYFLNDVYRNENNFIINHENREIATTTKIDSSMHSQ